MTNFVLVHGSGQNASGWSRLGAILTGRGHTVRAPDLPKRAAGWRLEDHAAEIAKSIGDPQTVVVAHSFSGTLLPLVPRTRECGLLVFLAAVIPEPGKSVREQLGEDPAMFCPQWIQAGSRWFDEAHKESIAREFIFHDCDEETLEWALRTVEYFDTRELVTQPSPFTQWPSVPTASIVATGDRTLSPDWGRRTTRRVLQAEPVEVEAGHCPHVSKPAEVADLLEGLAADMR